jgi:non-specific serine/threonine protein kinase
MIGQKISHYKILDELGTGGMGIVYKAHDSKLNRTVALKFVVPRIVRKKEDKERFVQEARTAASLNHPNICTIYEIDEQENKTFIAMEYIEGKTLRDKTSRGPLKQEKVLDYAVQIADGLQDAHDKGIIHRDIKSSNIMVTRKGQPKIMDFGLAMIKRETKITETATIMGTVAYMSPEQASGEHIDQRTDIWSLGVVLFEMLSGRLPFEGDHEQLVLYGVINKNPLSLSELRRDIPQELERIVYKCLEKDPAERYQYTHELLIDLKRLKKETETGIVSPTGLAMPKRPRKAVRNFIVLMIFLVMAAVTAGGYFLFDWFKPSVKWKASIAVLPIENMNPQKRDDHLCSGIPMMIASKLFLLSPELRVVPYQSVRKSYSDLKEDIIQIGKEVNVDHILSSSLQSEAQTIRISARLVDVVHNRIVGSFEYTKEQKEILTLQDEISKEIVADLGLHFTEKGLIASKKIDPVNFEAYDNYLQGMDIIEKKDTYTQEGRNWDDHAIKMFENAISIDPNYALAYWGLGSVYEACYVSRKEEKYRELMLKNYKKAYHLDPGLAEANLALGWAYFYIEEVEDAAESFARALAIDSDSELINCDVGAFLSSIGLYRSSLKYFSRAIQINPSYLRAYDLQSMSQWYIGKFKEGARITKKALELEDKMPKLYLKYAMHLIMLKELDKAEEAIEKAEKIGPNHRALSRYRALLIASRGKKDRALELIQGMERIYHYINTCVYSLLGMNEKAIDNVKTGIERGFKETHEYLYSFLILKKHPCYNALNTDPRFKEILKKEKETYQRRKKWAKSLL